MKIPGGGPLPPGTSFMGIKIQTALSQLLLLSMRRFFMLCKKNGKNKNKKLHENPSYDFKVSCQGCRRYHSSRPRGNNHPKQAPSSLHDGQRNLECRRLPPSYLGAAAVDVFFKASEAPHSHSNSSASFTRAGEMAAGLGPCRPGPHESSPCEPPPPAAVIDESTAAKEQTGRRRWTLKLSDLQEIDPLRRLSCWNKLTGALDYSKPRTHSDFKYDPRLDRTACMVFAYWLTGDYRGGDWVELSSAVRRNQFDRFRRCRCAVTSSLGIHHRSKLWCVIDSACVKSTTVTALRRRDPQAFLRRHGSIPLVPELFWLPCRMCFYSLLFSLLSF